MATIFSDLRDYVYGVVDTAYATDVILNVESAERRNIRFLIAETQNGTDTGLNLPYSVCVWGPDRKTEFGAVNSRSYEKEVEVYYIASTRDTDGSALTAREALDIVETKCNALASSLHGSSTFNVLEHQVDCSHTNPANSYFLANNMPMIAGSVIVKFAIGVV